MSLYAFDAIDDAFAATKAFLWPFDLPRWAKLALVSLFVGGAGGGFNPGGANVPSSTGGGPGTPGFPSTPPTITGSEWALIAGIVAVVALIVLFFMVVGSIMEFVFFESLRQETVALGRYWGDHWRRGLRLFGFRLVLGLLTLVIVGAVAFAAFAPLLVGSGSVNIGLIFVGVLVFVVVAVLSGVVSGFTTVFVAPVMMEAEVGVLAGWRRFWPTMTGQWKQYGAYLVMGFVLQIAAGIVAAIAILIGAVLLAIPFGIVALIGVGLLSASSVAGWAIIVVAAALWAIALLVVYLFVAVPIQTFLRYYALFVLGDTNADFDLIAERRAAVRADEPAPDAAGA